MGRSPELGPVASRVTAVHSSFHSLADSLAGNNDEDTPKIMLDNEAVRFRMWASNLAANQSGRASLDHRLQDAPHLQKQALDLLGALNDSLCDATAISSNEDPPSLLSADNDNDGDNDGASSSLPLFSDIDVSPSARMPTVCADIHEVIDPLLRLSVATDNPTPHERFRTLGCGDSENMSRFETDDIRHVNGNSHSWEQRVETNSTESLPEDLEQTQETPPVGRRDAEMPTLLARACARGKYKLAKKRLARRPIDMNVSDHAGNMPLHISALNGYHDIVKLLLDAGCARNCMNQNKDTPLLCAVNNGHTKVVRLLVDAGAEPRIPNADGEEPLDRVRSGRHDAAEMRAVLMAAKQRIEDGRPTSEKHSEEPIQKDGGNNESHSLTHKYHPTASVEADFSQDTGDYESDDDAITAPGRSSNDQLSEPTESGTSDALKLSNINRTPHKSQDQRDEKENPAVQAMEARKSKSKEGLQTIRNMVNLASIYTTQGRLDKAEELLVKALKASKSKFGADDIDTMMVMNILSIVYQKHGQCDKAEKLRTQVVKICKSRLGADHPDSLVCMTNLAILYRSQGRQNKAEKLEAKLK